jgi:hypothetical protein
VAYVRPLLLIGISIFSQLNFECACAPKYLYKSAEQEQGTDQRRGPAFSKLASGTERGEDGFFVSFSIYRAANNEKVMVQHCDFYSDARAKQHFERVISKALEVLVREPAKDNKGAIVGERAEAVFAGDQLGEEQDTLLSTNGSMFQSIASKSRRAVLDFQEWLASPESKASSRVQQP